MEEEKRIEIPHVTYEGDDKKLKERVSKFKEGSLRIAVFTIVGFVMGAFSHTYTGTGFFPMKLILAIPYKLSEAIYVSVIGTDAARLMTNRSGEWFWLFTEFFPHSYIATFLAETCTTILIGGAIYGSLAYFTGDKRVFTLQRFLKYGAVWCGVILIAVGASYLVNAKAVYDNENFKGDPYFIVCNSEGGGSGVGGEKTKQLMKEYFYSELKEIDIVRDYDKELNLEIYFNFVRCCRCLVNYEKQYVVTEQGRTYHVSGEFAQVIRQYEEEGVIMPEALDGEQAEKIGGTVE